MAFYPLKLQVHDTPHLECSIISWFHRIFRKHASKLTFAIQLRRTLHDRLHVFDCGNEASHTI